MTQGLRRSQGHGFYHYITCSCFQRAPILAPPLRTRFLEVLEEHRKAYRFKVIGYVVMPEHFHLLISEPERQNVSLVMQLVKQKSAADFNRTRKAPVGTAFWQARFYDFDVITRNKAVEKIRYMHNNPVVRGLVEDVEDWEWSSFRFYRWGEVGPVEISTDW